MSGLFGGSSSVETNPSRPLTANEFRLIQSQVNLARLGVDLFRSARREIVDISEVAGADIFARANQTFANIRRQSNLDAREFRQQVRQLSRLNLEASTRLLERGGRARGLGTAQRALEGFVNELEQEGAEDATPEEIRLINEAAQTQIEAGQSDIGAFRDESLREIRNVLGPSRGLRPGDTPLIDRGQDVAREALRQQGQLVRGVRSSALEAQLQAPRLREAQRLQRLGLGAEAATAGGGIALRRGELQLGQIGLGAEGLGRAQALFEQAQTNRGAFAAALQGSALQAQRLRLGLASGIRPQVGSALGGIQAARGGQAVGVSSQGSILPGIGAVAGGAGGLLEGLTAAGVICDRDRKNEIEPLKDEDLDRLMERLDKLGLVHFTYKSEGEDAPVHVGPYAQEFRDLFGYGASHKEIHLVDALGVLFGTVKQLNRRVRELEEETWRHA